MLLGHVICASSRLWTGASPTSAQTVLSFNSQHQTGQVVNSERGIIQSCGLAPRNQPSRKNLQVIAAKQSYLKTNTKPTCQQLHATCRIFKVRQCINFQLAEC